MRTKRGHEGSRGLLDVPFTLSKGLLALMKGKRATRKIPVNICRVCSIEFQVGDELAMIARRSYVHSRCLPLARQDIPDGENDDEELETFFKEEKEIVEASLTLPAPVQSVSLSG